MRIREFISEDTNQFGPGTDLVIALMALLMVMIVISTYLYDYQKKLYNDEVAKNTKLERDIDSTRKKIASQEKGGNFKIASIYFSAGTFRQNPYTALTDETQTKQSVIRIVQEYQGIEKDYPYIFIIGHANQVDDPQAIDKSDSERRQRNWKYAGERASVIAKLLQEQLSEYQRERIVVMSTGEFDMRFPDDPLAPDNAWVEVVFGKEWKLPSREGGNTSTN